MLTSKFLFHKKYFLGVYFEKHKTRCIYSEWYIFIQNGISMLKTPKRWKNWGKKEKELMDMNSSVVTGRGGMGKGRGE